MNFKKLQKVRDFIATLPPKACNMTTWISLSFDEKTKDYVTFKAMEKRGFHCGSAACIGGWTELMTNKMTDGEAQNKVKGYISAYRYLEIEDTGEGGMLFMEYPDRTPEDGWKKWILKRLDGVLKDKEVKDYREQMAKERRKK